MSRRTLVIGWDAADWSLIRPMVEAGLDGQTSMPNLANLLQNGQRSVFEQTAPLLPNTLWATLMTGVDALTHQVFDELEPREDGSGLCPVGAHVRAAPALWELTEQAGCPTTVVGFPTTHPMAKVSGVGVSDVAFANPDAHEIAQVICPGDFAGHVRELRVRPEQITAEMVAPFFTGVGTSDSTTDSTNGALSANQNENMQRCLAKAATWQAITTAALQHRPWQAAFVRVPGFQWFADAWQSIQTMLDTEVNAEPLASKGDTAWQIFWTTACQFQDMVLGRLIDLAGKEANVLLVANHGLALHGDAPCSTSVKRPSDVYMAMAQRRPQGFAILRTPGRENDALPASIQPTNLAPIVLGACGVALPEHLKPQTQHANHWTWPNETNGHHANKTFGNQPHETPLPDKDPTCLRLKRLGFQHQPDPQLEQVKKRLNQQRRHMQATACLAHGRLSQAFDLASDLVAQAPNETNHRLLLARTCLAHDKPKHFVDCVKPLLGHQPTDAATLPAHLANDPIAWLGLGMVNAMAENKQAAKESLTHAEQTGPPADWFQHMLGRAWLGLDANNQAMHAFEKALKTNPQHAAAWAGKGEVLHALQRFEQASDCLKHAIAIQPDHAKWHAGLGRTLLACKQWHASNHAFEKAMALGWSTADVLGGSADALLAMGDEAGSQQRRIQATLARMPQVTAFW